MEVQQRQPFFVRPAESKHSHIVGHRGAPSLAPENTIGGFQKAAELGVEWVELDVTLLADGTPVVNHDATIDRCSDQHGLLAHMTVAHLEGIKNAALYQHWPQEPVPLLSEVLALLQRYDMCVNIELKDHGHLPEQLVQAVIALLRTDFPDPTRVVISSFNQHILMMVRQQAPYLRIGLLYRQLPVNWLQQAEMVSAFSIHCDWRYLNFDAVTTVKAAGYQLYCWTANEPQDVVSLLHWGVDAVITDNPQDFL